MGTLNTPLYEQGALGGADPFIWVGGGVLGVPTFLCGLGVALEDADPHIWAGGGLVGMPTPLYVFGGGLGDADPLI